MVEAEEMAREFAKEFYESRAWKEVRQAVKFRDYGVCKRCGKEGSIVHHKVHLTPENINDPSVSLNMDNLELLCIDCHNREHISKGVTRDGLCFNSKGDLVPC